jgi:hypothetical protein
MAWVTRPCAALPTVSARNSGDIAGGVCFRGRDLPGMMMLTSFRSSRSRRRSLSCPEKTPPMRLRLNRRVGSNRVAKTETRSEPSICGTASSHRDASPQDYVSILAFQAGPRADTLVTVSSSAPDCESVYPRSLCRCDARPTLRTFTVVSFCHRRPQNRGRFVI